MENICSFEPLWKDFESDAPKNDIANIRLEAVKIFLRENESLDIQQSPSMDYIVTESLKVMKHLLSFWKGYNPIIARLRTVAVQTEAEPIIAVKGAIALWYTSSVSILKRDIHQGVSSEEEIATFEDGTVVATWNRDFAAEKHYVGNLGLMAMLLTTEVWLPPNDSKLQVASLVSCGATTMLFAAYMISSRMPTYNAWRPALSACPGNAGIKLFLQSAWRLAQKTVDEAGAPPGADFGAHVDEIRLCRNGKGLLSKVGRADWGRTPFWHPCRKIPGSHWNKWIKNTCRPIFPKSLGDKSRDIRIVFRLPSSAAILTSVFGDYYSTLRTRFDQTNRPRSQLTVEECEKQFRELAAQTGCEYPSLIPALETAASVNHLDQEYLYNLPMVKKPISDPTGNLTLPFLTTAIRALRFGEDPDEIEQNLFMMTFSLTILSL
ncbi:MAT1-1-2 [Trichoderma novae-zelandiae]